MTRDEGEKFVRKAIESWFEMAYVGPARMRTDRGIAYVTYAAGVVKHEGDPVREDLLSDTIERAAGDFVVRMLEGVPPRRERWALVWRVPPMLVHAEKFYFICRCAFHRTDSWSSAF